MLTTDKILGERIRQAAAYRESERACRRLRHNYSTPSASELDAYRRRCAEIRELDRRADAARADAGAGS